MRKATPLLTFMLLLPVISSAQGKRRVAVLDFNYATVRSGVQAIFGTNEDVGKGVTDLLIDKLVNGGTYRVIERQATSTLVAEQNFSNSNRADPSTAAKIGKLLGVDAIIIGDITQFGRDDHNTSLGGVGGIGNRYGLGGLGMHSAKATVAITARMVDVNTGEILVSETGKGTSKRSGANLLGGGASNYKGGGGGVNMSSSNFSQTIIGEAVTAAVDSLATSLTSDASRLPTITAPAPMPVSGLVADVSGNNLVLNVGSNQGIKVGDTLKIVRPDRVIRDPSTGRTLRTIETSLGNVTITNVDPVSSAGTFSGSMPVKVGDAVKSN